MSDRHDRIETLANQLRLELGLHALTDGHIEVHFHEGRYRRCISRAIHDRRDAHKIAVPPDGVERRRPHRGQHVIVPPSTLKPA